MKITDLGKEGKGWVKQVKRVFQFDTHELETLYQAGRCLDLIAACQEKIDLHGPVVTNELGALRPNPACGILRDQKTLFARLNRELELFTGKEDPRLPRKGN